MKTSKSLPFPLLVGGLARRFHVKSFLGSGRWRLWSSTCRQPRLSESLRSLLSWFRWLGLPLKGMSFFYCLHTKDQAQPLLCLQDQVIRKALEQKMEAFCISILCSKVFLIEILESIASCIFSTKFDCKTEVVLEIIVTIFTPAKKSLWHLSLFRLVGITSKWALKTKQFIKEVASSSILDAVSASFTSKNWRWHLTYKCFHMISQQSLVIH